MIFSARPGDHADVSTLSDNDWICYCLKIDKKTINEAIRGGATTLKEIKERTTACTGNDCAVLNPRRRCCSKEINALLKLAGH